jgi:site-specific recombinase XerD
MRVKREFQIYKKTHRSGSVSWLVNAGNVDGKRHLPAFRTRDAAEHYRACLLERKALQSPSALSDLTTLAAANVRLALERLAPYEASLLDAVDYFIKFAKPPTGKVTIQEAMDSFERDNRRRGLSAAYLTKSRSFFSRFRDAFGNRLMNDVTSLQAKEYIYANATWSPASKNCHIRHLRALYSATIKAGHVTRNPFRDVVFVQERQSGTASKILSVDEVEALLDYALENDWKEECAVLALVLFCGVRMEEASRAVWEEISLDVARPRVRVERVKNSRRRVNDIPSNAVWWLRECFSTGRVGPPNFEKCLQRLRAKAGIKYRQNAARHSFASYHVAMHDDAARTAVLLGHPNPTLLYSIYRECVSREEAVRFFDVVPRAVREERLTKRDESERQLVLAKQTIQRRLSRLNASS